jgi:hypothetical protein
MHRAPRCPLFGLTVAPGLTHVWAAGVNGTLLRWERGQPPSTWQLLPLPTTRTLTAVAAMQSGELFVVGDAALRTYDGAPLSAALSLSLSLSLTLSPSL